MLRISNGRQALCETEEMVKHVKVIVVKLIFHLGDHGDVDPIGGLCVVIGLHFWLGPLTEIKVERMRNGASSLASVRMVKDGASLGCRLQGGWREV